MRNLTKTIAAISIFAPATAFPMGIGDITLHSALNQKLDAEIALILSGNENISDIKVKLAPPEKFDEAGVPWSYFLSKIKFKSVVRADGSTVVQLSSNEALREPFLDFLLEVSWNKGSLYREFTVLVDPPTAYTQPVIPIVKKAQSADVVVPNPAPQPIATVTPKQAVVSKTIVDPVNPAASYGPTRRNDSLWKVAKRTNAYNDVSIEQMMMAIYKANQKSFYKDNVNALMAGETLDIPDREVILQLSQKQAMAKFRQHTNVWKGRVVVKAKQQKPVVDAAKSKEEEINAQLELEAPVEAEIVETAIVVGEDATNVGDDPVSQKEKGLVSASNDNLALQSRMEKLEQQLVIMQKMLALKDEQLAALQSKEKTIKDVNVQKLVDQKKAATEKAKLIQQKNAIAETKSAVRKEAAKSKPVTKPKVKAKPVIQEKAEEGFMSNPLPLTLAGVGLSILALLGLFLWRKRNNEIEIESDTESMFATASEISLPETEDFTSATAVDDTADYDVGTVGESSFLSEFTPSDFDAFDTDQNEVDPISEADVYLAYGRYQQAEDLMRQAIEDQPERDECKLKLLEIFYANENKSSFAEYATELVSSGKNSEQEFWSKVVEMGVELDPASTIYTSDAEGGQESVQTEQLETSESIEPAALDEDATTLSEGENEADFDLSVFDKEGTSSDLELNSDAETADAIDFDLSAFDLDKEATATVGENDVVAGDEIESIDFDLTKIDTDKTVLAEPSIEDGSSGAVDEAIESFDFDMDTGSSTAEQNNESIDMNTKVDLDESLELLSEGAVSEDLSVTTKDDEKIVSAEPSSIEGFDFDFDSPSLDVDAVVEPEEIKLQSDVSDLTDMDELETKIDLAKAYIDMGDTDAAKGIVKEVLEKGTEEQKAAAQAIIDQLE